MAVELNCPVPITHNDIITLAHGGGGRRMAELIDNIIIPSFPSGQSSNNHDGAIVPIDGPVAFTTDSYVITPQIFPGGNIGDLAINGTVNDVAMSGARPLVLSVGFVLEEGLPMETLRRVVQSMQEAASRELELEYQSATKEFQEKLILAIETFGRDEGFTMILDRSQVAWFNASVDVTSGVIDRFNKMFTVTAAAGE